MNKYWYYSVGAWLSRHLPEKLAYWIGLRVADRFYSRDRSGREAVRSNIRRIFTAQGVVPSEVTLNGLARKTYQYFGKYLIDFFRFAQLTERDVSRRVNIDHREYLDQSLQMGRGVLLVTAHFGNWELGGAAMAALGYKLNALVLPERLEQINRMFERQRRSRGINPIPVGHAAFNVVRLLKKGEIVAVLGDRDFTGKDDRVEFFGEPARIPRGPAWLSVKTGAPVVPVFLLRLVDDSFLLRFYPPILPEQAGSIEAVRLKICEVLQKEIGELPFQWFIFDDFWANGTGERQKA